MKYFLGSSAIQKLWEYGMIFLLCVLCINVPLHAEDEEECWNDSLLKIITTVVFINQTSERNKPRLNVLKI